MHQVHQNKASGATVAPAASSSSPLAAAASQHHALKKRMRNVRWGACFCLAMLTVPYLMSYFSTTKSTTGEAMSPFAFLRQDLSELHTTTGITMNKTAMEHHHPLHSKSNNPEPKGIWEEPDIWEDDDFLAETEEETEENQGPDESEENQSPAVSGAATVTAAAAKAHAQGLRLAGKQRQKGTEKAAQAVAKTAVQSVAGNNSNAEGQDEKTNTQSAPAAGEAVAKVVQAHAEAAVEAAQQRQEGLVKAAQAVAKSTAQAVAAEHANAEVQEENKQMAAGAAAAKLAQANAEAATEAAQQRQEGVGKAAQAVAKTTAQAKANASGTNVDLENDNSDAGTKAEAATQNDGGPTPSLSLRLGALDFVNQRRLAYRVEGQEKDWKLRGNGHLYTYQKIVLAAQLEGPMKVGRHAVVIHNVHPDKTTAEECDKLLIWVRLNGPEIFAGKAQAVMNTPSNCFWKYDVDIQTPGNYSVHAKPVLWNGQAPLKLYKSGLEDIGTKQEFEGTACPNVYNNANVTMAAVREHNYQNTSLMGFKMYATLGACCEECRRMDGCKYFATPPKRLPSPSKFQNGCELYFDAATPADYVPTTRIMDNVVAMQLDAIEKKRVQAERKQQMLLEQQKKEDAEKAKDEKASLLSEQQRNGTNSKAMSNATRKQRRHVRRQRRIQQEKEQEQQQRRHRRLDEIPLYIEAWGSSESNNTEVTQFLGCGWSFQYTLEFPCLSGELDDMVYMEQRDFLVVGGDDASTAENAAAGPLPLCTLQDESIKLSLDESREQPVGRWVREAWPDGSMCAANFSLDPSSGGIPVPAFDGNSPHCWNREDLTPHNKRCVEMNCRLIKDHGHWLNAPLQEEKEFMGVWRNFQCDYLEFTNAQLSECLIKKKIAHIRVEGASIAGMIQPYLQARLVSQNITMYNASKLDATAAVVSSLKWPHLLWHSGQGGWRMVFHGMKPMEELAVTNNPKQQLHKLPISEFFWVTPFFGTSEREPYVHAARAMQIGKVAEEILTPKGYKMINVFDPSAAFTYDTAAQRDGLHIIGPPLKTVVTKVFHHMCADVVDGSRA